MFLTTGNSTIQLAAPPQMRGRVTGLWTTAFIGSTPIGAVVIGAIAHFYGGRGALAAGFVGCVVAVVAGALILSARHTIRPNGGRRSPDDDHTDVSATRGLGSNRIGRGT